MFKAKRTIPTPKPPPPTSSIYGIIPRVSPTRTMSKESSSDKETMSTWGSPSSSEVFVKARLEPTTPPGSPEKKESLLLSSSFFSLKISLTVYFVIYIVFTINDPWTWIAQT